MRLPTALGLEVALQYLHDVLADQQLAQVLQVGQAPDHQHALDDLVGVLHLVDGLVVLELGQALEAPVLEHAVMQEVLVDRRQLHLELGVEEGDDLLVALHN